MRKVSRLLLIIILLVITSVCILNAYSSSVMTDISSNILRLHIVASSDSAEDQNLKLKVRDNIVTYTNEVLAECENPEDAYSILNENLGKLEEIANETIKKEGFDYCAEAKLGIYDFPTKDYGDIILPGGEYTSLRIVIGEGVGQNWWCVLFPPLCFINANASKVTDEGERKLKDSISDDSYSVIKKADKGVKFKFKIVEVFESAKMRIQTSFKDFGKVFKYNK